MSFLTFIGDTSNNIYLLELLKILNKLLQIKRLVEYLAQRKHSRKCTGYNFGNSIVITLQEWSLGYPEKAGKTNEATQVFPEIKQMPSSLGLTHIWTH